MATSIIKKAADDMLESATYTGKGLTLKCYRRSNGVSINLESGTASSAISAGATIMTIGERFRPCAKQNFLSTLVTTSGNSTIRMSVETSGELHTVGTAIASGAYPRFSWTYVAGT